MKQRCCWEAVISSQLCSESPPVNLLELPEQTRKPCPCFMDKTKCTGKHLWHLLHTSVKGESCLPFEMTEQPVEVLNLKKSVSESGKGHPVKLTDKNQHIIWRVFYRMKRHFPLISHINFTPDIASRKGISSFPPTSGAIVTFIHKVYKENWNNCLFSNIARSTSWNYPLKPTYHRTNRQQEPNLSWCWQSCTGMFPTRSAEMPELPLQRAFLSRASLTGLYACKEEQNYAFLVWFFFFYLRLKQHWDDNCIYLTRLSLSY